MKLIVHGQQAFGKSVLEAILEKGLDQVVAVYCAPDKGSRIDPLKEFALEKGLEIHQPESYKAPSVWEQMKSLDADLCVMAYVTLYVPEEALNTPRFGSIQYHPSLLPRHKGPSSINWPIIFGATKTGLSVFWPDKGLDTGPILLQKEIAIGADDTLGSLYFDSLYPLGVEAMMEAIELVRNGNAPKQIQDPNAGTYEGWCRKDDVKIDWSKPVNEVYNLIRGANPQPGAWTLLAGKQLQIYNCQLGTADLGEPGEIIALDDSSFSVATSQGSISVSRVKLEGEGKIPATEFVSNHGITIGVKLG